MSSLPTRGWFLIMLLMSGCLPYVTPSLEMTPPVNVGKDAEDVHVFRVDVNTKWSLPIFYDEEQYSLRRIPLIAGAAPPQVQAGLDRGLFIPVALVYHIHYHDGCHVRLYRPGFELVEFKSWQFGKQLEWKTALSLVDQEMAIDNLITSCGTIRGQLTPSWRGDDHGDTWKPSAGLSPGSFSEQHKTALLFAATEYERLATMNGLSGSESDVRRLREKAEMLRKHASR